MESARPDKSTSAWDTQNRSHNQLMFLFNGDTVTMDNLRVLDREQDWMKRKVKEAIHIKQRAPSINRD